VIISVDDENSAKLRIPEEKKIVVGFCPPPEKGESEGVTQNKDSSNVTPPNLPFSWEG
jgi:hypothetical protein